MIFVLWADRFEGLAGTLLTSGEIVSRIEVSKNSVPGHLVLASHQINMTVLEKVFGSRHFWMMLTFRTSKLNALTGWIAIESACSPPRGFHIPSLLGKVLIPFEFLSGVSLVVLIWYTSQTNHSQLLDSLLIIGSPKLGRQKLASCSFITLKPASSIPFEFQYLSIICDSAPHRSRLRLLQCFGSLRRWSDPNSRITTQHSGSHHGGHSPDCVRTGHSWTIASHRSFVFGVLRMQQHFLPNSILQPLALEGCAASEFSWSCIGRCLDWIAGRKHNHSPVRWLVSVMFFSFDP